MKNRVIFGILILFILLLVLFMAMYVTPIAYDVFVLILMFLSAYEMSKALSNKFKKPLLLLLIISISLAYVAFKIVHEYTKAMTGYGNGGITSFFIVLVVMLFVCILVNMASSKHTFENVLSTFFCMIYPIAFMVYFLAINYLPGADQGLIFSDWAYNPLSTGAFIPNYRAISILLVLAGSAGSDMFALFVGISLKGPKLAPRISPKKTVSGAIGGLFGGLFGAGVVFGLSFTGFMGLSGLSDNIGYSLMHYMFLGLGIAVTTELGDLVASYIKRFCEIKDYGNLIPGHGGILDRIDGIIISSMFVYLYMYIMVVIQMGR